MGVIERCCKGSLLLMGQQTVCGILVLAILVWLANGRRVRLLNPYRRGGMVAVVARRVRA